MPDEMNVTAAGLPAHVYMVDWARLARAGVAGALCLLLSAGGHLAATGMAPRLPALLLGSVVAVSLSLPVYGRRRPLSATAAQMAALQLLLHWFFSATVAMPAGMTMNHSPAAGSPPSLMFVGLGHSLAAVCAAYVIRRGDAAISTLCALACQHCAPQVVRAIGILRSKGIVDLPALVQRLQPIRAGETARAWVCLQCVGTISHRGPPGTSRSM